MMKNSYYLALFLLICSACQSVSTEEGGEGENIALASLETVVVEPVEEG